MSNVLIGIDLSLRSPGLAIYNPESKTANCYYHSHRKKDVGRHLITEFRWKGRGLLKFNMRPFNTIDIQDKTLYEKYDIITSEIIDKIMEHEHTIVILEGYAFNAQSSSATKLHELGGILKYKLNQLGREWIEIPPTRVKKYFTGSGRAQKKDMYNSFISKGFPKLLNVFQMEQCKDIPNPVQDMVDAFALIECFWKLE